MPPKSGSLSIGGQNISVSNLDKVLFPKSGFTKGQVIDYYIRAAEFLLPHLKDRPLTMKRFPDGILGEVFYEKNAPRHAPEWVKTVSVPRSSGGIIRYILVNDLKTLVWTANLANLEMHVFLSKAKALHRPTSIVFDLDPGEGRDVLDCAKLALALRTLFDTLGFQSFAKVSGSKGMQVYLPLNTACDFERSSRFAKTVAQELERKLPGLVVSRMSKALRKGKIFIDWSQNSESKTTVAVYSLRAKRDEPFISLPFEWREIEKAVEAEDGNALFFSPEDALARMKKKGDLFAPLLTEKQKLSEKSISAVADAAGRVEERLPGARRGSPKTAPARKKSVTSTLLGEYRRKRDFAATPEPGPAVEKSRAGTQHLFVIQKHQASHLHFDFRLEMQGVLKSWAVPKGPPLARSEKRLAMLVEDHPLDYKDFEGIIPEGNYGAGTVMVWDSGTYECMNGKPLAAFFKGEIKLRLDGKKLRGGWVLVKDRRDDRKWLLIMEKSAAVVSSKKDLDRSVVSGRTLAQIEKDRDSVWGSNRKAKSETGRRRRA